MATLYVMCGLAFAGKSTLARALAARTGAEIASLDDVLRGRGLEPGAGLGLDAWERASAEAVARLERGLRAGRVMVLDDTCSRRFLRDRYRDVAGRCAADASLIWLDPGAPEIDRRIADNARTRRRPAIAPHVLAEHRSSFEPPGADESPVRLCTPAQIDAWLRDLTPGGAPRDP